MTVRRRFVGLGLPIWWLVGLAVGMSAWAILLTAVFPTAIDDWRYHVDGARILFSTDGLRLYVERPDIQIGPLSLALAGGLDAAIGTALDGSTGSAVRWLLAACFGPMVLLTLRAAAPAWSARATGEASTRRVLAVAVLGGLLAGLGWAALANSRHLDDALAVVLVLLAVAAVGSDRPRMAGALAALAVWAKPWAIAAVPVLLGLKDRRREAWLVAAATLLPLTLFLLVDVQALRAAQVRFATDPISPLSLLSDDAGSWGGLRLAQLVAAIAVGALVARRSIWCAPAAAFVTRLLLDPGAWAYYFGTLLVLTLLADLARPRRPWATPLAALTLIEPFQTAVTHTIGLLAVLVVLVLPSSHEERVATDVAGDDEGPRPMDGSLRST